MPRTVRDVVFVDGVRTANQLGLPVRMWVGLGMGGTVIWENPHWKGEDK